MLSFLKKIMNYNVNYELWVVMKANVGSSLVKSVPLWWAVLIMGEAMY